MKKLLLILTMSSPALGQTLDRDNDGVDDAIDNCMACSNSSQSDVDGDGIGDACDLSSVNMCVDADVDGICDGVDPDPTPTETCDDGLQNQDETGVDCGGVCASCVAPDPDPTGCPSEVRYDQSATHSPLTCSVMGHLGDLLSNYVRDDAMIMRAGDSHSINVDYLNCLSHPYFTGFTRTSLAATGSQTASWGNSGPFVAEMDASNARWALIMFGTNDLWYGGGPNNPQNKFQWWYDNTIGMVEDALAEGVIPVLFTIPPHEGSQAWFGPLVSGINAMVFGLGQHYQVPVINLHDALLPLPDRGLLADGIHLNRLGHGLACDDSALGLEKGHNMRNHLVAQALERFADAMDGTESIDGLALPLAGDGSSATPYQVDALPFADSNDGTAHYQFAVQQETTVRIVALSVSDTPDLTLSGDDGSLWTSSRILIDTLQPGIYTLTSEGVDSMLTIVECDNAGCAP